MVNCLMASIIRLAPPERRELKARSRARSIRAEASRRAQIILHLAAGKSLRSVSAQMQCSINTVQLWKGRFEQERIGGLYARHAGKTPGSKSTALEARILEQTRRGPEDGSTHWSTRKLARRLRTSHMRVARAWARAGLQPHRLRRYMASDDPCFEAKAADVIGLYLNPPAHAAVFCVDEKTAIQALDRLDPVLPLSPGRAERHGFEYYRHGTLSLYAALSTRSGQVLARTVSRHNSAQFVAFLGEIVAHQPSGKEIHLIVDNLSAHKTKTVQAFLAHHPEVHLHFTPTYSSWLNQIELWFSKIERDLIARGVFHGVKDLARKIMRYTRRYNKEAKPFKWSYCNTAHRIAAASHSRVTVH